MTRIEIQQLALALPDDERLALAEALWVTLADRYSVQLPAWQEALLDLRLAESAHEVGKDWDELKTELWGSQRR